MKLHRSPKGFTLIELLVVISIIAVLATLAVPTAIGVMDKANQMTDINNGKNIYLALKLFATDNEGRFPWADYDPATGEPMTSGSTVTSANAAYKNVCPRYIAKKGIFFLSKSGWTVNKPDEGDTAASSYLQAGQCAYAYVPGLYDTSNPSFPLIADAFSSNVGTYTDKDGQQGGIWKGKVAMVVRVDGSVKLEKCTPTFKVAAGSTVPDIFASSATWIPQAPVNPN